MLPPPPPSGNLVLAASDSSGISDYKCTGAKDELVVQAAIDAAAAAGKGLKVKAGHYKVGPQGDHVLQLPSNTILDCEVGAVFQVVNPNLFPPATSSPTVFLAKGWTWWPITVANRISNVQIYNLDLELGPTPHCLLHAADGTHPKGFYYYLPIKGIIDGLTLGGVTINSPDPKNLHFVEFYLWHCNKVLWQNCAFDGVCSWVFCYDPTVATLASWTDGQGFEVANCTFRHGHQMNVGGGMFNYHAHDNTFYNSDIIDPWATAIDCYMSPSALIENNKVYGAGLSGIYSEGASDIIIRGNYIENARSISQDTFVLTPGGWGGWGIDIFRQHNKGAGARNQIYDNHIVNCNQGIDIEGCPNNQIYGNLMESLRSNGITINPGTLPGYAVTYSDYAVVAGNTINGFGSVTTGHRGIALNRVQHCDIGSDTLGAGNIVDGKGNAGAAEGISEVDTTRSDYNNVHGNTVTGCKTPYVKKGAHSVFTAGTT